MMNINEIRISLKHIKLMKHALGLEKDRFKNKNYLAYRNYYTSPNKNNLWEDLVELDFAMRLGKEKLNNSRDY